MTSGRLWLEVLPGAFAFVGGIVVLMSRLRPVAALGAWLAALGGAWFAVGGALIGLWSHGISAGSPVGGKVVSAAEQVSFFAGLGIVIVFMAALALGRLSMVAARDVALAEQAAAQQAAAQQAAADEAKTGRSAAPVAAATGTRPARGPVRAILTKVVPGRTAASEEDAADSAAAERRAGDRVSTS